MTVPHAISQGDPPLLPCPPALGIAVDLMGEAYEMWRLPMAMMADWWTQALDAGWRNVVPGPDGLDHKHSTELIVPDILEEDGEHALFA